MYSMYRYTRKAVRIYRMQVFTRHISLSLKSAHGHCNDVARIIFILRAVLYIVMGIKHTLFLKRFLDKEGWWKKMQELN
jgi:hypothetical protein